jgi:hypothetical protein
VILLRCKPDATIWQTGGGEVNQFPNPFSAETQGELFKHGAKNDQGYSGNDQDCASRNKWNRTFPFFSLLNYSPVKPFDSAFAILVNIAFVHHPLHLIGVSFHHPVPPRRRQDVGEAQQNTAQDGYYAACNDHSHAPSSQEFLSPPAGSFNKCPERRFSLQFQ